MELVLLGDVFSSPRTKSHLRSVFLARSQQEGLWYILNSCLFKKRAQRAYDQKQHDKPASVHPLLRIAPCQEHFAWKKNDSMVAPRCYMVLPQHKKKNGDHRFGEHLPFTKLGHFEVPVFEPQPHQLNVDQE